MSAVSVVAPQRIFVTGATGVIGAHALPLLISQGHEVTAVGRSPEKRERLQKIGARAIELDTFDVDATRRALDGITTVINLATHMPLSSFQMMLPWKWRENDLIRREGSAALVQASLAAGVQRFIQESFAPVYEDGGDKWIAEGWPLRPAPYNRSVLDAERSATVFTEKGRIGIIARFAGFYGPDAMLREMIGVVKKGYSPLPGSFTAYWSSVAHEDAASAVVALVGAPAGPYNVSDDEPLSRRDFAARDREGRRRQGSETDAGLSRSARRKDNGAHVTLAADEQCEAQGGYGVGAEVSKCEGGNCGGGDEAGEVSG